MIKIIFDLTNFSEELDVLLQLLQLLGGGGVLGVVIQDAAAQVQVGDLGEAVGQGHADVAQDDRPSNLLIEGRSLDPLDRALNQNVSFGIMPVYDLL